MANVTYFVRMRGRVTGPFELAELQTMAFRGSLSRVHEVSSDRVTWLAAGKLAEVFATHEARSHSAAETGREVDASGAEEAEDGTVIEADARSPFSLLSPPHSFIPCAAVDKAPSQETFATRVTTVRVLPIVSGIAAGIVLLVCANLPHTRREHLVFWWNANSTVMALTSLYLIFAALAAAGLGATLRDRNRGAAFLAMALLGLLLLLVAGLFLTNGGTAVITALATLMPLAGLLAVLVGQGTNAGKEPTTKDESAVITHTFAAVPVIASLLGMLVLATGVVNVIKSPGPLAWGLVPLLPAQVAALVFCSLVIAAARNKHATLILAAIWAGAIAMALTGIACVAVAAILTLRHGVDTPDARFAFLQALRLTAAAFAMTLLLAVGVRELVRRPEHGSGPRGKGANRHQGQINLGTL